MTPDIAYEYLFRFTLLFLSAYAAVGIYRSCRGPEVCDRIMGVNMIGSAVIACMLTLTVMLSEAYLADIAIIYALVNFLSVIVLRRVYGKKKNGGGEK